VDLGASSGRVFLFALRDGRITFEPVARFSNGGVFDNDRFVWDVRRLYDEIVAGLTSATDIAEEHGGELRSVGVDSWAVDYGLLDSAGTLLGNPVHHRDTRTDESYERATQTLDAWTLYQRTGIALLRFNTLFQLVADGERLHSGDVSQLLLIPDLINFFLSGKMSWEKTNASTTQLLTLEREWDSELFDRFHLPASLVGPLNEPGVVLGTVSAPEAIERGVSPELDVVSVASHDTASAVLAVPATNENFAYISSGTWSLVGVEIDKPIVNEEVFAKGYTNELGAFGKTRFLRNVMGFWLLQEVIREFAEEGQSFDAATLTNLAEHLPVLRYVIDAESEELLPPGDMRGRLARMCEARGGPVPTTPPEFTRCILDSLALAYRRSVRGISDASNRRVDVLHIVGGGAMNETLCQLSANACEIPVVAGPVEAAAIGNALMQFQALGVIEPDLWLMRNLVTHSFNTTRFEPQKDQVAMWQAADESLSAWLEQAH